MTKPVTSVAIMMLYEQGKLDLDDPVSKFIPEFADPKVLVAVEPLVTRPAEREITIRHLLTHTSGLGYPHSKHLGRLYEEHGIPCGCVTSSVTLEDTMKTLAPIPLLFDPGEGYEYGMSTDVLGRVVEVASGTTLDQFFAERIFSPLGMNDTFFKIPENKRHRLTSAYLPTEHGMRRLNDGEIVKFGPDPVSGDYPYSECHRYLSGGGDLSSTPGDYMRFCQMLLDGGELNGVRLLKEDTIRLRCMDHTGELARNFGFGFTTFADTEGVHEQLRGAYAWFGYWCCSFRVSPRGNWIIVTMSQVAWNDDMPNWFARNERIAAESVVR